MGTGDARLIEAAQLRLSSAEADFGRASAPVNVPLNFVFSKSGCAMASLALKTRHQIHPTILSICGDVSNMYNDCDQPASTLTASPTPQATAARRCSLVVPPPLPPAPPRAPPRPRHALPAASHTREDGAVPLPGAVISLNELTEPDPQTTPDSFARVLEVYRAAHCRL